MKSSIDLIKEIIYNHCMDMFVALADPTRRTILELLASNEDRFSSLDAVLESEKQKLVNDEQKSG
jgi:hypothetical protein